MQFNLQDLLKNANFKSVKRVDYYSNLIGQVTNTIQEEQMPIIIENVTSSNIWNTRLFSVDWLEQNAHFLIKPRNQLQHIDEQEIPLSEFLINNKPLLYAKDVSCPEEWQTQVMQFLPEYFCYRGSNDLCQNLPQYLFPENLMIYIGSDGTFTPGHCDICASVGHNLMISAEEGASTFWFMIHPSDYYKACAFWEQETSGTKSLFSDDVWMEVELLKKAPFNIYVIEQKQGDFVVIPSHCAHQVVNQGGRTVKVSWNRMTSFALQMAYNHVLPLTKSYLKRETYRIKSIIHFSALKILQKLQGREMIDLNEAFNILTMWRNMIENEWIEPDIIDSNYLERFPPELFLFDCIVADSVHTRVCDFCNCDIWNRFYYCSTCECATGKIGLFNVAEESGTDLCIDCYVEGRVCAHAADMRLNEHIPMTDLVEEYKHTAKLFNLISHNRQLPLSVTGSIYSMASISLLRHNSYQKPHKQLCSVCDKEETDAFYRTCSKGHRICHLCVKIRYKLDIVLAMRSRSWLCLICNEGAIIDIANDGPLVFPLHPLAFFPKNKRLICGFRDIKITKRQNMRAFRKRSIQMIDADAVESASTEKEESPGKRQKRNLKQKGKQSKESMPVQSFEPLDDDLLRLTSSSPGKQQNNSDIPNEMLVESLDLTLNDNVDRIQSPSPEQDKSLSELCKFAEKHNFTRTAAILYNILSISETIEFIPLETASDATVAESFSWFIWLHSLPNPPPLLLTTFRKEIGLFL